ncbi:MAG: hypothetical protein GY874_13045 [Desulfobacteraceae bacterium]|nr:hypothetical protein [Desulfobacteraceae bacterium]
MRISGNSSYNTDAFYSDIDSKKKDAAKSTENSTENRTVDSITEDCSSVPYNGPKKTDT